MGDHVHHDNLSLLNFASLLLKVPKFDDLLALVGPSHHCLILEKTALDRLNDLLGDSIVLGHQQLCKRFKPLRQASVSEDVTYGRLQIVLTKVLSDLWLLVDSELVVSEDKIDQVVCLSLHLRARLTVALSIGSCMQVGLRYLVD